MKSTTDAELIQEILNGNKNAFEIIMNAHKTKIYTFIYRMVNNRAHADDLFQETFLKIYKNLRNVRNPEKFLSWALKIAACSCMDFLRKEKRDRFLFARTMDIEIIAGTANPENDVRTRQELSQLTSAIASLPLPQREILLLRISSGLSFKEIADTLDKPLNTVLGLMYQAIVALRIKMKGNNL